MSPLAGLFSFALTITAVAFFFLQVACCIHEAEKILARPDHMIMEIAAILLGPEEGQYHRIAFCNLFKTEYY